MQSPCMKFLRSIIARSARRSIAGGMLVCYALVMFGVPLPESAPEAGSEQPYPCQHHACGCRSAEQCWRSCCCFTDEEKLAWAERNGVTPPDSFAGRRAVQGRAQVARLRDSGSLSCSRRSSSCSSGSSHCGLPDIANSSPRHCCKTRDPNDGPKKRIRLVVGIEALKCRGLGAGWTIIGDFVPPAPQVLWQFDPFVIGTLAFPSCRLPEIFFPPPAPPPRGLSDCGKPLARP